MLSTFSFEEVGGSMVSMVEASTVVKDNETLGLIQLLKHKLESILPL